MNKTIYFIGFWSGLTAFLAKVGFVVVQMLQLIGIFSYPWDEVFIYGFSLCIVIPFMLEMLALHHIAPARKKFWSHAAILFTAMYVVFVTANYVVQLAMVIPMTLKGAADEIRVLVQTPHSLFWNFDAIGYIFMGLATLFAVPVFNAEGFQRWVRYVFLAHGLVTPLIAFVYFYPDFSEKILLIDLPWAVTAPLVMLFLALMFYKGYREKP